MRFTSSCCLKLDFVQSGPRYWCVLLAETSPNGWWCGNFKENKKKQNKQILSTSDQRLSMSKFLVEGSMKKHYVYTCISLPDPTVTKNMMRHMAKVGALWPSGITWLGSLPYPGHSQPNSTQSANPSFHLGTFFVHSAQSNITT